MTDTPSVGVDALHELRAARRRRRIQDLDWFEAAYRAYLAGIVGIVITLFLSSWLGDNEVDAATLADVLRYGPAAVGLLAALAIGLGLRSGSRGGPLAVESAEVRYVLLSPLRHRDVLLGGAFRSVRHAAFLGAVVGAIAGQLAGRRLGGSLWAWAASGAGAGALIAALFVGAAMVACGLHVPRWAATLLGAGFLAWAIIDLANVAPSPTTTLGSLAFWPVRVHWADLAGVMAVVAVIALGLLLVGRLSLEDAERRTALVGQLRFAVTLQDLRTVLVLRRQLAQDNPRHRPWIRLGPARRFPVWRRDWHGVLRFPGSRLVRLVLLAGLAGLCLRLAFDGIPPLLIVSGLCFFLAGLEAAEPMAQDIDQSDRTDSVPRARGELLVRHLPAAWTVMLVLGVLAGLAFWGVRPTTFAAEMAAIVAIPAALCGGAGGIVSVLMGAPDPTQDSAYLLPEVAGMKIAFRTAWPIIVAVLGSTPVLVAHRVQQHMDDTGQPGSPLGAAATTAIFVLVLTAFVGAYVRYRDMAKAWFRQMMAESQQAAKERQAARTR